MPSVIEKESIEGFGLVYLEANYFNCPVIGTASGGISEAIINEKTGLLVKQNDIDDLVEKILFLYKNEDVRKKMGVFSYERIIKEFNWEIIINDYIKVFNNLLFKNK